MARVLLSEMTWEEVAELARAKCLTLVPVGSTEEHGPHLPLGTDSVIAEEVCVRAAERLLAEGVPTVVGPAVRFGYESREVRAYPGTIALSAETLVRLMRDYLASLISGGLRRILVVNAHGQNYGALRVAVREVYEETGVPVAVLPLCTSLAKEVVARRRRSGRGGILHAGELETSLMLCLRRGLVRLDRAVREVTEPPSPILGGDALAPSEVFLTTWSYWETERGVLGDPTVASEELGRAALEAMVQRLVEIGRELYFKVFPRVEGLGARRARPGSCPQP